MNRILAERIIQTNGSRAGMVLDPFCGCGTTIDAAEKLGLAWLCRPYGTRFVWSRAVPAMNGGAIVGECCSAFSGEHMLPAWQSEALSVMKIAQRFSTGFTDQTNPSSPAGTTEPCTHSTPA